MGFFDQHAVTLRRPDGPWTRDATGYAVAPAYTESTIRGNLQRAPAKRTETPTEGERSDDVWTFATRTQLRATQEESGTPGDQIIVPSPLAHPSASVIYEVRTVSGPEFMGQYEARLVRVSEGAS